VFLSSGWWWLKPAAFILVRHVLWLLQGGGVWSGESLAWCCLMLNMATFGGVVIFLEACSWPSPCLPPSHWPRETLGPVYWTRRRRRHGVVILLKTSSRPLGGTDPAFRDWGRVVLQVLAAAQGVGFRGAIYAWKTHLGRRLSRVYQDPTFFSPTPSRRMKEGTLVRVALELRSSFGGVLGL
jgi:hypothetical protein